MLERLRHLVHVRAEFIDLIAPLSFRRIADLKFQLGHMLGNLGQFQDRIGDSLRDEDRHNRAHRNRQDPDVQQELVRRLGALPDAL